MSRCPGVGAFAYRVYAAALAGLAVVAMPAVGSGQAARNAPPPGTAIVEADVDGVYVFMDGRFIGRVARDEPLRIMGLPAGEHEFRGVQRGYEPAIRLTLVPPGRTVTVPLRIRHALRQSKAARDLVEQGERLLFWGRQGQSFEDLERARDFFEAALEEESRYPLAWYYLGMVQRQLYDYAASLAAYREALDIDPGLAEARVSLAGVLVDIGDPAGAMEELVTAQGLLDAAGTPGLPAELHAMLARVYGDAEAWAEALESARQALELDPSHVMALLWNADALRHLAAEEESPDRRQSLFRDAREGYRTLLAASTFESSLGGMTAPTDAELDEVRRHRFVYRDVRSAGYQGLCLTERRLHNLLRAREYCERALVYDDEVASVHFLLGSVHLALFDSYLEEWPRMIQEGEARASFHRHAMCGYLTAAARSYRRLIELNPFLVESDVAREQLERVEVVAPRLECSGA